MSTGEHGDAAVGGAWSANLPLPSFATSFVGREHELAELRELLERDDCRLVTIVGPGGMGKTRLATEVARRLSAEYEHGALFVALDAVTAPEAVPMAIAAALHFQPTGQADPAHALGDFFRDRQLLLVLDNFEQVTAAAATVSELLARAPMVRCLVTSREVLNLREEWAFTLDGMRVPESDDGADWADFPCVQLLAERVRQTRPDFELDAEPQHVVRICHLVDGIPLGLELAASWARYMDLEEIGDEIERSLGFLETTLRNVPERHRGLEAVFQQSWELLEQSERTTFQRLSVFRGGFAREAASAVAGATLPLLATLVDKSLVRREPDGRYTVHELLRQFAEQRLASDAAALQDAEEAHTEYFLQFLVERLPGITGSDQVRVTALIARELSNLRLAWTRAVDAGRTDDLGLAAWVFFRLFQHRSQYLEAATLFGDALERLEASDDGSDAQRNVIDLVRVALAWFLVRLGRLDEAEALAQRALDGRDDNVADFLPGLGSDPHGLLGVLAMTHGRFAEAAEHGELARERAEARDDTKNQAIACYVLENAALAQGRHEEARTHAEAALQLTARTGERWFEAYVQNELGNIAQATGDLDAAHGHFEAGYAIQHDFGDPQGMALALGRLGETAFMQRQLDDAARAFRESLLLYRDIGNRGGHAQAQCGLGRVASAKGDVADARARFAQALRVAGDIGFAPLIFDTLCGVGELLLAAGDYRAAVELLSFVGQHQNVAHSIRQRSEAAIAKASGHLSQRELMRARRAGRTRELDDVLPVVTQALSQAGPAGAAVWAAVDDDASSVPSLSDREFEILRLIASGRTNPQIARELDISVGTVKWHSSQIFGKLSVKNRTEAAARVKDLGLLA